MSALRRAVESLLSRWDGYNRGEPFPAEVADQAQKLKLENRRLESQLDQIRLAIQGIVCVDGIDAGVIYISDESPTHWDDQLKCDVYDHECFSPLGDALVNLWKLAKHPDIPTEPTE